VKVALALVIGLFAASVQAEITVTHLGDWRGGSGQAALQGPVALAIDASGLVYVVEQDAERVRVFTADGTFVRRFGASGTENGQFTQPNGIAVDSSGNVYVSDLGASRSRVQKFAPDGSFLGAWRGAGPDRFGAVRGVTVDASGNVYVADEGKHRVLMLAPDGTLVTQWSRADFAPWGLAVDDDRGLVYASDRRTHREGPNAFSYYAITPLTSDGEFQDARVQDGQPQRIALDRQGRLYGTLADGVRVYSPAGRLLGQWGGYGTERGQFQDATGIALDDEGLVYVADFAAGRVSVFQVDFN
jgi:DNA-binding beta-propeller fold protein YncE